ncbi:MAG: response regulator transcription factor [Treponema sp.]|jgi:DNA-binding response OmpR family regulator|nr:response regulator transcription factor [Treponema sp.]
MKEKQTVLVIDDEPKILELVKSYLEINGFTALCAGNGKEALEYFEGTGLPGTVPRNAVPGNAVSLILLDLMLPDMAGEDFCRKVRRVSGVPIIMITAKVEEEDIIRGLGIGADDYVCKPFSPRQLMARVQAVLRRSAGAEQGGRFLSCGNLRADTEGRSVSLGGTKLALTRDEYSILTLLLSRRAKIFTRDEILDHIKGKGYGGFDRSVDTHIKNLRAKIGDDKREPKYIQTVYGMGYRLGDIDGAAD